MRELELFSEELSREKAEGDRYASELLERNGNLEKAKSRAEEEAAELAAALRARELAFGSIETISEASERLSRHNDALQRQV